MKSQRTSESIFGNTNTSEEARTRHEEELRVRRADAVQRGRIVTRIGLCVIVLAFIVGGVWMLIAKQHANTSQAEHNAANAVERVWEPEVSGNPDAKMHVKIVAANDMDVPMKINYLLDRAIGIKPSTICVEIFYLDRRPRTADHHDDDAHAGQESVSPSQSIEISVGGKKCYEASDLYSLDYNALSREIERIYHQCYPDAQYPLEIPEMKMRENKEDALPVMSIPQLPETK